MTIKEEGKFTEYLLVGLINTLFGYSCYVVLYFIGLIPELALLLASIFAVIFNYFTFSRLVFKPENKKRFGRYLFVFIMLYIVNKHLLDLVIFIGLHPLLGQGLLAPVMAGVSYVVVKEYVFSLSCK